MTSICITNVIKCISRCGFILHCMAQMKAAVSAIAEPMLVKVVTLDLPRTRSWTITRTCPSTPSCSAPAPASGPVSATLPVPPASASADPVRRHVQFSLHFHKIIPVLDLDASDLMWSLVMDSGFHVRPRHLGTSYHLLPGQVPTHEVDTVEQAVWRDSAFR